AAAAPAPAIAAPAVTRTIDLAPRDWFWATWRPWRPLPKSDKPPAPFDRKQAVERFEAGIEKGPNWWFFKGPRNKPSFSREEAHFWFSALTLGPESPTPAKAVKNLEKGKFNGRVTLAEAGERIPHAGYPLDRLELVLPFLFDPADLIALA